MKTECSLLPSRLQITETKDICGYKATLERYSNPLPPRNPTGNDFLKSKSKGQLLLEQLRNRSRYVLESVLHKSDWIGWLGQTGGMRAGRECFWSARHRSIMSLVLIGKLPRFYLLRISDTADINMIGEFAVIVVICSLLRSRYLCRHAPLLPTNAKVF